ncbi:MAG: flagellar FliJ family protein [Rhodospirillales bacterium]|jgi:flagellar export protein FliJ|nr:flagellar FliJ family protein [Rhodospirillales bacterium]
MRDPLAILIRLAAWRLDADRRSLAATRQTLTTLSVTRDGVTAEMACEAAVAMENVNALAAWRPYAERATERVAELEQRLDGARADVGEASHRLRAAFTASKRLEILSERRACERRIARERQEQAALDDRSQARTPRPQR